MSKCLSCEWKGNKRVCSQCSGVQISQIKSKEVSGQGGKAIRPKKQAMTQAEAEYGMMLRIEFPHAEILYEAMTIRMSNGHKYTPDWVVIVPDDKILCVEVKQRGKNGFRQASYGRAKLAFDQAAIEFNCFSWRWCEKTVTGWVVKG